MSNIYYVCIVIAITIAILQFFYSGRNYFAAIVSGGIVATLTRLSTLGLLTKIGSVTKICLFILLNFFLIKLDERFFRKPSQGPHVNLIGKILVLSQPLQNGQGWISIGDTIWKIQGPNLPKGTPIIVFSVKGDTLYVKKKTEFNMIYMILNPRLMTRVLGKGIRSYLPLILLGVVFLGFFLCALFSPTMDIKALIKSVKESDTLQDALVFLFLSFFYIVESGIPFFKRKKD